MTLFLTRFDLIPVAPTTITRLRRSSHISSKTLYIPQPERDEGAKFVARAKYHDTIKLTLPKKTQDALSAQGYTTALCSPDDSHPSIHSVTLAHSTHTITIYYRHDLSRVSTSGDTHQTVSIVALARISEAGQVQDTPVGPEDHHDEYYDTWKHWTDRLPWGCDRMPSQDFVLNIPGPTVPSRLRLVLTIELAARNHYRIDIKLATENPLASTTTTAHPRIPSLFLRYLRRH